MTNQTIPPCPVCGVVPVKHAKNDRILLCGCFEEYGAMMTDAVSLQKYQLMCVDILGRACRELGVETVAQLKARLAPDPRVAVLDRIGAVSSVEVEFLWYLSNYAVDNGTMEDGLNFKAKREQLVAAQRGEGV